MKYMLVLDYSTLFPDEEPLPLEDYFKGVNKEKLKKVTSYFLGIDFSTSHLNNWRELLKMWFRHENHEFANKVGKRCELLERKWGNITFLRTAAFLKFFEFVKSYDEADEFVDEVTSERNLFIVYLLFLSQTTDKETISNVYIETLPEKIRFAALILNQQFAYGEYANVYLADAFKAQVIKAGYFFLFLENTDRANYLLSAFCNFYKLKSWQDYFKFIIPIIQGHALHPKGGGWTHLNVIENEDYERNCYFLETLSQEVDIESDFKSIRSNPLYKVNKGIYGIIYPLFVIEKIFKGSYFKLKELNDAIEPVGTLKKISDWKGFYTDKFSESILLYSVLHHIYGKRSYIQFSGDDLKAEDKTGPPDYYIRNGNVVYLFENKDILINGDIRQSYNFQELEQALKDKLYYTSEEKDDGSVKIKQKAVLQLVKNIKKVLTKANKYDVRYKEHNINIYPILILHDWSFECPGLNTLVNYWFELEMEKLKDEGILISKVRKITIINIDTLLLYADFLKQKIETLHVIIDAYIKKGIFIPKKKPQTKKEFEEAFSSTFEPFSHFINEFTQFGFQKVEDTLGKSMIKAIVGKKED
jgi:hypothetical protein